MELKSKNNIIISVIMVVYNKEVQDIKSVDTITKYAELLIVDNSTNYNTNKNYCISNNISYYSMGGNKGLSKAYNVGVKESRESDLIVLMDDDTLVPDEYFIELFRCERRNPHVDIFAPIIRGQDGVVYSPNNYNFLKNKLVVDPQKDILKNKFNAISSCLAIRKRVFDSYSFNEILFVDEIDHCFCREQREKNREFLVMDVVINQNFHQRASSINAEVGRKRVCIRIIDIFRHARIIGGWKYVCGAFIKGIMLGFQMGLKSKSIKTIIVTLLLSIKLLFVVA